MKKKTATKKEKRGEVQKLRARLEEAEETLRAIRSGEVDALVVEGPEGERVFTLKGADRAYQLLMETMNEGAALLMEDGVLLYANRYFAEMLEVPLERLIGASIKPFVHPDDRPTIEALLDRARKGASKGEIAFVTAGKADLPAHLSINTIEMDNVKRLGLVATDLTEQKRTAEIVAAEKLARSILEQAAEAIVVCDETGRVIRASQVAHRLAGQNIMFKDFDAVFPLVFATPRKSGRKPFSISVAMRRGGLQGIETQFERKDGEAFYFLVNAGVLANAQGKKVGCVVTLTDITEQKRAEEGLKRKTIDAEEASRFKSRFVSNVSHELRTPLNAIIGYTDLLLQGTYGGLNNEQASPLRGVLRNGKDLLNLVNDLLDLSRIEAGKLSVRLEPVEIHVLLKEIVAGLESHLGAKPLEIRWRIDKVFPILRTDAGKVKQIFVNLLTNAIKFTPKGQIVIAIKDLREKDGIEVAIQDTGIGIQPEEQKKIFEMFHQVDSDITRNFGGAGLGLAIVKEFVQFLQGQISVQSSYGKGSIFTVFLPRLIASETVEKNLLHKLRIPQ